MPSSLRELARDQGRGVVGGLLLGLPLLYTMETWWVAWTVPPFALALFAVVGLVGVSLVVHVVGFRPRHEGPGSPKELLQDFAELVLQSAIATYAILFLFGLVGPGRDVGEAVRLGLIQIVPVGFGAAVANRLLHARDDDDETSFRREMATFALGALFFAFPIAPTEEIELIAAQAGWWRLLALALLSVVLTYLALYELQFRGSAGRSRALSRRSLRLGETCAGYVLALGLSLALLAAYGHLSEAGMTEATQQVVVLGHVATLGGAAARVVI